MGTDKGLSYLGLATRAGKVKSGSFLVEKAIKERSAKAVFFAADADSRTVTDLKKKCEASGIPWALAGTKETLGQRMGKEERSCAAILDEGLARAAIEELARKAEKR